MTDDDDAMNSQRGPAGDARPNADQPDRRTRGGQAQEAVEDRPTVGTTTPDKYPDKAKGSDA